MATKEGPGIFQIMAPEIAGILLKYSSAVHINEPIVSADITLSDSPQLYAEIICTGYRQPGKQEYEGIKVEDSVRTGRDDVADAHTSVEDFGTSLDKMLSQIGRAKECRGAVRQYLQDFGTFTSDTYLKFDTVKIEGYMRTKEATE